MAKKILLSFLILATTVLALSMPVVGVVNEAIAAERNKPRPQKCLNLAREIGAPRVWWGRHVGARETKDLFNWGPRKEAFNTIGCFKSRAACEDWLYWARTEYPEFANARPCRRGL